MKSEISWWQRVSRRVAGFGGTRRAGDDLGIRAIETPATLFEIQGAYRLVLGREPDPEGLAHYLERASEGLCLSVLLNELLASSEYLGQLQAKGLRTPSETVAAIEDHDRIRPDDVIRKLSVDELIETAEEYYRRITDPSPLMAKPFAYWHEAPQMLHDLGLLLSGMHLGKTMTVLDFGAGTCWLSRILAQLNCQPISCDVSPTALAIGKRLMAELPLLGTTVYQPVFLQFDGRHIDLPSESVERIICFDSFHHVPNPSEVLREFGRVLKPGGVLGMSEPGRRHSASAQSQYEMANHRVLENDIDSAAIFIDAQAAGFTSLKVKAVSDQELTLEEYNHLFDEPGPAGDAVKARIVAGVERTTFDRSIFFLAKGPLALDSRGHVGLAHRITAEADSVEMVPERMTELAFVLENVGRARWLATNIEIFGTVRLASHLFSADGSLLELDFSRHPLPMDVAPGDSIRITIDLPPIAQTGRYRLAFDLVSEGVTWFENVGSACADVWISVNEA